jgi:hypothetical protein
MVEIVLLEGGKGAIFRMDITGIGTVKLEAPKWWEGRGELIG